MLLISAGALGAFLGLNYNFLVLVPVTLVLVLTFGGQALMDGQTILSALVTAILPSISMQAGYMVGLTAREMTQQFLARFSGAQSRRI
jgi:hypothetical protein